MTLTDVLIGLINVFWAALVAGGAVLRKQYESRLADKDGVIAERDERLSKYEAADEARRTMSDRAVQALEQAVGIAKAQNETINTVVDKQGGLLNQQGALLARIAERQDEAKATATRRARTP